MCSYVSHIARTLEPRYGKPFFLCENKDADQLRGNREADQRLCFRYTDSTIRVATVREKSLENEIFSRSGKSQGISILVREI